MFASKPALTTAPSELTRNVASAIWTVVLSTIVVEPCTVKLPVTVASPAMLIAAAVISSLSKLPLIVALPLIVTSLGKPICNVWFVILVSISLAVPTTFSA